MSNLRTSLWTFYLSLIKFYKNFSHLFKISYKNVCWVIKSIVIFKFERLSRILRDVGDKSGILALKLVFNRNLHVIERIFWFVTFIVAICGALLISKNQIMRHLNSPTVISVDRNYRDWDGFMPAITLCYYDHIDSSRASDYILKKWNVSIANEKWYYFMDFVNAVANASVINYAGLAKFADEERFDRVDLYEIIRAVGKPLKQVFSTFTKHFALSVHAALTERGYCYVINSPIGEILRPNFTMSLQSLKNFTPSLRCKFGKEQCVIQMDLLERTGAVDVHSPFEISVANAKVIALRNSDEVVTSYKVSETVASSNLRDLTIEQRKCVFHDEETSGLKIYGKSFCVAKCRAMIALETCGCVPFFYTFVAGPSCNPSGFECLLSYEWPSLTLNICKCPHTCTEVEYILQTIKKTSWSVNVKDHKRRSYGLVSSFRWHLIPPKVRMRREVVFSFEDLLVAFGGILGLFLGISILSLIFMIYAIAIPFLEDIFYITHLFSARCNAVGKYLLSCLKYKKVRNIRGSMEKLPEGMHSRRVKRNNESSLEMQLKSPRNKVHKGDNNGDLGGDYYI